MLEWGRKSAGRIPLLQEGSVVAEVHAGSWRERADVEMNGVQWHYYKRAGELNATVAGEPEPRMIATKPSGFGRAWEARTGPTTYRIEPMGCMNTNYRVLRDGAPVGKCRRAAFWSNRPTLEVDPSIPSEEQAFLLWIAFIMRRRDSGAGASAGAGGGT